MTPVPGSTVENLAIYGPNQDQTLEQFQQSEKDAMAARAAANPAPPGFASYEEWSAGMAGKLAEIKAQNDKIIAMLEARQ